MGGGRRRRSVHIVLYGFSEKKDWRLFMWIFGILTSAALSSSPISEEHIRFHLNCCPKAALRLKMSFQNEFNEISYKYVRYPTLCLIPEQLNRFQQKYVFNAVICQPNLVLVLIGSVTLVRFVMLHLNYVYFVKNKQKILLYTKHEVYTFVTKKFAML